MPASKATDAATPVKKGPSLLGEWRWEKYVMLIAGIGCLVDAGISSAEPSLGFLRALVRDGAFHSGLLFFLLFYASEARYRLFPELRND